MKASMRYLNFPFAFILAGIGLLGLSVWWYFSTQPDISSSPSITLEVLKSLGGRIGQLPNSPVQKIWLNKTKVKDDDLTVLADMDSLDYLDLRDTAIGDTGLKNLGHLPNLEELSLAHTRISDNALKFISQWDNL